MADSLVEMEKRLSRLERRAQFMFGTGFAALAAAVLLVTAGPGTAQGEGMTVKAPFRVVDAANNVLFEVDREPDGPAARLFGAPGKLAAHFRGDKDGGTLSVLNADGKAVAQVASRADGAGGSVSVYDKAGQPAGSLMARPTGSGGELGIYNRTGKIVGALFARSDGSGGEFRILNQEGVAVGSLFARPDNGGGDFGVYDKSGKVMASLLARPDGAGGDMVVYNRAGKVVGALFASGDTGNLIVRDGAGKDLFTKP